MTHTVASSNYIITTIIIWINSACLPLCPWITAVKHHVNDKDELWRAAERNWLWITRTQRLLQWCLCQALSWHWAFLSYSINQRWEVASFAILLQPWKQCDSLITLSAERLGLGCHCICHHSALPASNKHVSCQGASGLYQGWQERRKMEEKAYLQLCSEQLLPYFTSAAKWICPSISTLLPV